MMLRLGVTNDYRPDVFREVLIGSGLATRGPSGVPRPVDSDLQILSVGKADIPFLVLDGVLDVGLTTTDVVREVSLLELEREHPRSFGSWIEIRGAALSDVPLLWAFHRSSTDENRYLGPASELMQDAAWDAETGVQRRLLCFTTHPQTAKAAFREWSVDAEVRTVPDPLMALAAVQPSIRGSNYCALALVESWWQTPQNIWCLADEPIEVARFVAVANPVMTTSDSASRLVSSVMHRFERYSTARSHKVIRFSAPESLTQILGGISGVVHTRSVPRSDGTAEVMLFVEANVVQAVLDELTNLGVPGPVVLKHSTMDGLPTRLV